MVQDKLKEWKDRHNVFIAAVNADNKIVAAGWFNLDNEPTKEDKKDVKDFYKGLVGYKIEIARGEQVKEIQKLEWKLA